MVADLWQRNGKISGCFKNSASIVLQQQQNKISFQRKGSGVVLKFLLNLSTFCPSKSVVKTLIGCQNPFFENLLYFDIAGEQRSAVFEETTYFAFSLP